MEQVLCPHCNAKIKHDGSHAGQVVSCPRCRGHLQMPSLPAGSRDKSPFQSIDEDTGYRPRPRKQPSYARLWVLALLSLLGIAVGGLWLSGVIQFKVPQKAAEQKTKNTKPNDTTGKQQPEKDRPPIPQDKPDAQAIGQEKKQQDLADAARKKAEAALRNPLALQAPPGSGGRGVMRKYPEFAQQMRELATNEFTFRKAQDTVYRSTFNQRDQTAGLVANVWFFAFNGILDPGSYDFERKRYSLTLYFWYEYYKESRGFGGRTRPETKDYCVLRTSIEVDPDTAAKIRAAYDKKSLSLTISYRLKRVSEGTWGANPHFNGPGRTAHNLAFEVETLDFDWSPEAR